MKSTHSYLAALVAAASLSVTGCGKSSPSELVVGELTDIRIGFRETTLNVDITRPGFYALYTRGDQDTVCRLLDSEGEQVAEDDDSGSDLNCHLVSLLKRGRYTAAIGGYDITDRGRVQAMVEAVPVREIGVGDVTPMDLDGHASILSFSVDQDGAYLMSTSGLLDTVCSLHDEEGMVLGYNDDFGDDTNCGMIQRLQRGRYHLMVNSYTGQSGRTTVMVAPTQIRTEALKLGVALDSSLHDEQTMVDFEAQIVEPGMYVFRTSGDTDTYCELRNTAGELMAENDDGDDHNCIIRHALTAGSYLFTVRGYTASTRGEFSARVDQR